MSFRTHDQQDIFCNFCENHHTAMTKIDYNIPSFYSLWVVIMKKAFKFTILCLAISSIVACSRNEPVATEKVSDEQRPPEAVRLQPVTSPNGSTQTPSTQLVEVDDEQKAQEKASITASDDADDADDNDDDRNAQPAVAKPIQNNDNVVAAPARTNPAPSNNASTSKSSTSNSNSTRSSSSNQNTASNTQRKTDESKTTVTRTNNTTTTITTTATKSDQRLGPAATNNQTAQNSNKTTQQSQVGPAANKTVTSNNKASATADKVSNDKKVDSTSKSNQLGPAAQQRTQQATNATEKTEKVEKPTTVQKTNTTVSSKSAALMDDVRPINNENRQHEADIGSSKSE